MIHGSPKGHILRFEEFHRRPKQWNQENVRVLRTPYRIALTCYPLANKISCDLVSCMHSMNLTKYLTGGTSTKVPLISVIYFPSPCFALFGQVSHKEEFTLGATLTCDQPSALDCDPLPFPMLCIVLLSTIHGSFLRRFHMRSTF